MGPLLPKPHCARFFFFLCPRSGAGADGTTWPAPCVRPATQDRSEASHPCLEPRSVREVRAPGGEALLSCEYKLELGFQITGTFRPDANPGFKACDGRCSRGQPANPSNLAVFRVQDKPVGEAGRSSSRGGELPVYNQVPWQHRRASASPSLVFSHCVFGWRLACADRTPASVRM